MTRLTPTGKLLALIAACGVGAVAGAAGAAATRPHAHPWRCVVVRSGDTLWEVAKQVSRDDPRLTVDRIVTRNGLRSALISPGTGLWVPAEGPGYEAAGAECGTVP